MRSIKPYLLLALLCALLYLPGIATVPMMDRDSAHFAQATKQMLQSNNYFQIRFQEKTRYQKPPGINWLQAMSVKAFSDEQSNKVWPYRVPSALGGLLSVLLCYFFAARFLHKEAAMLGASLLAVTLLLIVESHLAVIDSSLLSSVIMMQGALWCIYTKAKQGEKAGWGWALLFWLAMGYGFVLKGVTPLVGFLTLFALSIVDRNWRWLKGLRWQWGIPLLLVSMVWLIWVNEAEQSNYLLKMVQKDLLPKLQGGHESHGQPPLFHLAILPLTFWPASLFLWQAGVRGWVKRKDQVEKFLLAWIVPTWVFFELMPTKLPQYVLPTFPAVALLAALAIMRASETPIEGKHWRWLKFLIVLWLLFSIGFACVFLLLPYLLSSTVSILGVFIFLAISTTALVASYFSWHKEFKAAAISAILGAVISYAPIYQGFLPSLRPLWLSNQIIDVLGSERISHLSAQRPLLAFDYEEPSLVFNLDTTKVKFASFSEIEASLAANRVNYLLIAREYLPQLESMASNKGVNLKAVGDVEGINYNKGKRVSLRVLEVLND
jgi:4-amino-4-deoxy-L-arabinose transferase-like glycosyltransferase